MPEENQTSPGGSPQGGFSFAGRLHRYNYAAIVGRLGKKTDAALAAEIGCSRKRVQELRTCLSIPSYTAARRSALDRVLGRYTDAEIARAFGYTRQTISLRRRQLGIPRANARMAHARHKLHAYLERLTEAS